MTGKTRRILTAGLVALGAALSVSAHATTIVFDDRTAFVSATGATGVGAIPMLASGTEFSIGGLNFKNVSGSSLNTTIDWSSLISEPFDLAINGVESFDVVSDDPLYSFGFDFHEPSTTGGGLQDRCNDTCVDSTFEVTLLSGATTVATFQFMRPDDALTFVGVWTSEAFDTIQIRDKTGTIDNEFFGNFLTGTTPVPEPSSLLLLGALLLGLASRRRHPR